MTKKQLIAWSILGVLSISAITGVTSHVIVASYHLLGIELTLAVVAAVVVAVFWAVKNS